MPKRSPATPAFGDPYEILGVDPRASDAEIAKAYRKLALKLHPDKQQGLSPEEGERVSKLFHDAKEARAFLLEPEHAEDKRKYDVQRASEQLRRAEDARKEARMSARRKSMREKLASQEEQLLRRREQKTGETEKDVLERLRREGIAKRESHAERATHAASTREARDRRAMAAEKEQRQVRLKWSRRRMKTSPSEHSLSSLLSRFGEVENVEIIGAKGNEALVTFSNGASCRPCVDFYGESDEMRAKFVGKRKHIEETWRRNNERDPSSPRTNPVSRDDEKMIDRKLRQADEREMLRQQMEMEDRGGMSGNLDRATFQTPTAQKQNKAGEKESNFPPPFPRIEHEHVSPLKQLEKFEMQILGGIISPDVLKRAQLSTPSYGSAVSAL